MFFLFPFLTLAESDFWLDVQATTHSFTRLSYCCLLLNFLDQLLCRAVLAQNAQRTRPKRQKQQCTGEHRRRLGNPRRILMERLCNLRNSNKTPVWRSHTKANVFGYIENRFKRNDIEKIPCFCGWIAIIANPKMAVSGHRPAKGSNGRGFVNCEHSVDGTAGIILVDRINRPSVRGHDVVEFEIRSSNTTRYQGYVPRPSEIFNPATFSRSDNNLVGIKRRQTTLGITEAAEGFIVNADSSAVSKLSQRKTRLSCLNHPSHGSHGKENN